MAETMAMALLAARASSAAAERAASVVTRLRTEERTSLKPQLVQHLGLLRCHLRSKWERKPRYRRKPSPTDLQEAAAVLAEAQLTDATSVQVVEGGGGGDDFVAEELDDLDLDDDDDEEFKIMAGTFP